MNEAPGPINFTMFLTMFGEKLNGTDPEDVIRNAFACFDEEGTGELEAFFNFDCALYHLMLFLSVSRRSKSDHDQKGYILNGRHHFPYPELTNGNY